MTDEKQGLGYLQMDTKHVTPELSGLSVTVYEFAALDITSRFKAALLLPDITDESASLALRYFLAYLPFKIRYIQTDDGPEYKRSFQVLCAQLHISRHVFEVNSLSANAQIKRSFRTDEEEFYMLLEYRPRSTDELNDWLQVHINEYNAIRPHQALAYQTPLAVVNSYFMN